MLGKDHSRALLGAYTMTGCDHIGTFSGLTKARCFNVFLGLDAKADEKILDALSSLGTKISLDSAHIQSLTRFVVDCCM